MSDYFEIDNLDSNEVSQYLSYSPSYHILLDQCKESGYDRLLTEDEIIDLVIQAQDTRIDEESNKDAINALTLYNIKLVVSIAARHIKYANGLSMDDLVEDGIMGLMRSIKTFDVDKGVKFSTYAVFWISQYITRGIDDYNLVRLPVHVQTAYKKYCKFMQNYFVENNELPSEEVTRKFCRSINFNYDLLQAGISHKTSLSLDQEIKTDSGEDSTFGDFVAVSDLGNPEEEYEKREENRLLYEEMDRLLSDMEKDVLICRFVKGETLETVGKRYNVTREWIRKKEGTALAKLKASRKLKHLKEIYA